MAKGHKKVDETTAKPSGEQPDKQGTTEQPREVPVVEPPAAEIVFEVPGVEGGGSVGAEAATEDQAKALAEAVAKQREAEERMLRIAAEFENYKKRKARECETIINFAEENLIKELLPAIDNLERAMALENGAGQASALLEGVELTYKGLMTALEKIGLTKIESVGKPFDPNLHNALAMEASAEIPAQAVILEFEKGYRFKDKLIRAAKVVVSKGSN